MCFAIHYDCCNVLQTDVAMSVNAAVKLETESKMAVDETNAVADKQAMGGRCECLLLEWLLLFVITTI